MPRPKKSQAGDEKDRWKGIEEWFRERFAGATDEEIETEIRRVNLADAALQAAMDDDEDLKTKKKASRDAGAIYRDSAKQRKLKTGFLRETLKDRGRALPGD